MTQKTCRKCKDAFETRKQEQVLCPKCKKKINTETHCFNCGRPWSSIVKKGTRDETRKCKHCGVDEMPNLLGDIFSIKRGR